MGFITTFLYSQFFVTPPYPTADHTGKTVIVTGSNAGLGLEAARHFARLNCQKLILAVRTVSKGEKAKESILESTKRKSDCIEVWELDLSSTQSVRAFADKIGRLERLDAIVENAGFEALAWQVQEGNESTLHVNVVNTLLLALLVLPKLRETQEKHNTQPHLTLVSSELAEVANFPEGNEDDIYGALNDEKRSVLGNRYPVTKLIQVLMVRELANRFSTPIINLANPGFCKSEFMRDMKGIRWLFGTTLKMILARTTEVGSRNLVAGACADESSHGQYMSDSVVVDAGRWSIIQNEATLQKRVYEQTLALLDKIVPGVSQNI